MTDEERQVLDELFSDAREYGFQTVEITVIPQEPGETFTVANVPVSILEAKLNLEKLTLVSWKANLGIPKSLKKHSHYFKDVRHLDYIDVYRVLDLFEVTDPCIAHAVKKLLVAGKRGGGKDMDRDVQEAIDTLERYKEIRREENEINRN
jgi:hypothetical protein